MWGTEFRVNETAGKWGLKSIHINPTNCSKRVIFRCSREKIYDLRPRRIESIKFNLCEMFSLKSLIFASVCGNDYSSPLFGTGYCFFWCHKAYLWAIQLTVKGFNSFRRTREEIGAVQKNIIQKLSCFWHISDLESGLIWDIKDVLFQIFLQ